MPLSAPAPAAAARTADRRDLLIAFGDREVAVRCDDALVIDALERVYTLMRPTATGRTVGELEVCREDGRYVVRGNGDLTAGNGSLADVLRSVRFAAIQFLIDARPDLLWLHAGAAAVQGRAVLFPGPPGSGKSTLVTRLCARRWSYLSDEIAPVDPLSQTVLPFPQTPAVRQYPGQEMPPEWLRRPNKRVLKLRPDGLCGEPARVAAVVQLSYRSGARAELSVSSPATTARHLLGQSWNLRNHRDAAVAHACTLSQRVPGFSLAFSDGEAAADVVARVLARVA